MPALLRRIQKSPLLWQVALLGYWLALFIGTHMPRQTRLLPPSGWDKALHLAAFAVLALLVATAWQLAAGHLTARHLGAVWLVMMLYAAFDESTQPLVGRSASAWDWAADAIGALLGLALFAWLREKFWAPR